MNKTDQSGPHLLFKVKYVGVAKEMEQGKRLQDTRLRDRWSPAHSRWAKGQRNGNWE